MVRKYFLHILTCAGLLVACQGMQALPARLENTGIPPTFANHASALPATIDVPASGTPTLTPFPTLIIPALTPYPDDQHFSIGQSWEGRDLWVWQFGGGTKTLILIGGLHGGSEGNTVVLVEQLTDYFRRNPEAVLPGIRLVLIPVANPDGLRRGARLEGRFNGHGVDLNRNWGCEWSDTAVLQDIAIDPGTRPFSEPETMALRAYFLAERPDAVIFYHSAAGEVFTGECGDQPGADWLGRLLSDATGYPFLTFSYYAISGDATNWLAEQGIPAAGIELTTDSDPEFTRNLAGVMALQCHFALEIAERAALSPEDALIMRRFCP